MNDNRKHSNFTLNIVYFKFDASAPIILKSRPFVQAFICNDYHGFGGSHNAALIQWTADLVSLKVDIPGINSILSSVPIFN